MFVCTHGFNHTVTEPAVLDNFLEFTIIFAETRTDCVRNGTRPLDLTKYLQLSFPQKETLLPGRQSANFLLMSFTLTRVIVSASPQKLAHRYMRKSFDGLMRVTKSSCCESFTLLLI